MKVAARLPSTSLFILQSVLAQLLIQYPLLLFKTGALNYSATRPSLEVELRRLKQPPGV